MDFLFFFLSSSLSQFNFLKHYDSKKKKADGVTSVVEEQEIKMNSTHQDSQRNTGSEAYSKWWASE